MGRVNNVYGSFPNSPSANGRLCRAADPDSSVTYEYTPFGQTTRISQELADPIVAYTTMLFDYDGLGRVKKVYGSGANSPGTIYEYSRGRVRGVKWWDGSTEKQCTGSGLVLQHSRN